MNERIHARDAAMRLLSRLTYGAAFASVAAVGLLSVVSAATIPGNSNTRAANTSSSTSGNSTSSSSNSSSSSSSFQPSTVTSSSSGFTHAVTGSSR